MEELLKQFHTLDYEIRQLSYSWRLVNASQYTTENWNQEYEDYNALLREIKEVSKKILPMLYQEREILEKKYPKFSHRIIYIVHVPKKVRLAEKRYTELYRLIDKLERYIAKKFEN
ncbi:MAG TPA: hypothetical protein PK993_03600 [Clostridia bacterium]|nr:hypothetical protein [Clostridia bacterium]